ncbi:MFS transporter [Streptomyces sp. NPDC005474]|uniref:MFS transporter n=1 Tax=Streptomyces sp. NPDC005474 TaxID=3154878 RepID=UPI003456CE04
MTTALGVIRPAPADFARKLYLRTYTLSAVGGGMWIPLQGVLLQRYKHLSADEVGWYFGATALATILINPLAGAWAERRSPYPPFLMATAVQCAGAVLVGLAEGAPQSIAGGLVIGLGNGMYFAVQTAILVSLFGQSAIGPLYGRQYQINNICIGGGVLLGGLLVLAGGFSAVLAVAAMNGVSSLAHGLSTVFLVRRRVLGPSHTDPTDTDRADQEPGADPTAESDTARKGGVGRILGPFLDPTFAPLLLVQVGLVIFGYAQIEVVAPVIIASLSGIPGWTFAAFVAVNCAVILLAQGRATAWVDYRGFYTGIMTSGAFWVAAFVIGAASMTEVPTVLRVAALLGCAVLFGVGEVLLSPSLQPLAVRLAPPHRLATYTGAMSVGYGIGLAIGPATGLALYSAFPGTAYWFTLIAGVIACFVAITRVGRPGRHRREPDQSYPRHRKGPAQGAT